MAIGFIILLVTRNAESRSTTPLSKSVRQGQSCIKSKGLQHNHRYVPGLSAPRAKLTLRSSWKLQLIDYLFTQSQMALL